MHKEFKSQREQRNAFIVSNQVKYREEKVNSLNKLQQEEQMLVEQLK